MKGVGQGHLPIARPNDFYTEVEKGNVPGHSIVHKFGHSNVDTTLTPLTISGTYQTPTSATVLEFVSDSANDNVSGVGAREITLVGIDSNYNEITQTLIPDGLTPVPLSKELLRLYRWYVSSSGRYANMLFGSHVGTLTIRGGGSGPTWSTIENIPFPAGQSEIGAYTVPNGFRAYIIQQEIHGDSAKSVDVVIFKRTGIDIVTVPFSPMRILSHYVGIKGINATDFKAPLDNIPAKTDFGYMGIVSNGTADVSVHFSILLIKDGY